MEERNFQVPKNRKRKAQAQNTLEKEATILEKFLSKPREQLINVSDIEHCLNRSDLDTEDNHHKVSPAYSGEDEFYSIQDDTNNVTDGNDADIMESDVILNIDSSHSTDSAL